MKKAATVSSKNQVTLPAEVRKVLGIRSGETLVFDIDTSGKDVTVVVRRHPTLEELAGSVPTPPDVVGLSWQEIRARAWAPAREGTAGQPATDATE
jgi:AbrB family looped-hinge helix DNA binding protein